jgi:hypothetical protein
MEVLVSTNAGSTFSSIGFLLGGQFDTLNNAWNQRFFNLGNINSATSVIRFRGYSNTFFSIRAIDSLRITTGPLAVVGSVAKLARLYPSPNAGRFTLDFETGGQKRVTVMSPDGRVLVTKTTSARQIQLLVQQPNGIYFVRIDADGKAPQVLTFSKQ